MIDDANTTASPSKMPFLSRARLVCAACGRDRKMNKVPCQCGDLDHFAWADVQEIAP